MRAVGTQPYNAILLVITLLALTMEGCSNSSPSSVKPPLAADRPERK
jgi:hypothetical protein